MLCERPSRRSDAKELHFRILAQPGCVFLEVPYSDETLYSEAAQERFTPPDRQPLPL